MSKFCTDHHSWLCDVGQCGPRESSEGGADLGLDENTSVSVPAPPSVEQEAKERAAVAEALPEFGGAA